MARAGEAGGFLARRRLPWPTGIKPVPSFAPGDPFFWPSATGIATSSKGKGWAPFPLPAATLTVSKLTPSLPSPRKMPKTAVALPRSPSHRCCSSCPWRCSCGDAACRGDAACNAPYTAETWEGGSRRWLEHQEGRRWGAGHSGTPAGTTWGDQGVNDAAQHVLCPSLQGPAWCRWWKLLPPQKPTVKGLCKDQQGQLLAHHLLSCSSWPSAHGTAEVIGMAGISPSPCLPRNHFGIVCPRRQRAQWGRSGLRRARGAGDAGCLSLSGSHQDFEHPGPEQPRHSPAGTGPLVVPSREAASPGLGGGPQPGPQGQDMAPNPNCTNVTHNRTMASSMA